MAVQWLEIPTQPQDTPLRPYEFPGDRRAARLVRLALLALAVGVTAFMVFARFPVRP